MKANPTNDTATAEFEILRGDLAEILLDATAGDVEYLYGDSVTELAEPFDMSMPAISKHLKVLERAGLIARGRNAQWRPCSLAAGPLKEVADWVEHYRSFWEQSFDRLDSYLRELQSQEKQHGKPNKN